MSSVPPGVSTLRLPLGDIVFYSTGRPCIRRLLREILGFVLSAHAHRLQYPSSRGVPLRCGDQRFYFIYFRSHGAVDVLGLVVGPELLRFFLLLRARFG